MLSIKIAVMIAVIRLFNYISAVHIACHRFIRFSWRFRNRRFRDNSLWCLEIMFIVLLTGFLENWGFGNDRHVD